MQKEDKPRAGPLVGLRVLDLTRLYPGPLGTMLMAEMGADVIKIEDENNPDPMRNYPPFIGEASAGYLAVNRGKRSLALDLQFARGRDIFFALVKTADIVVEQFRPGVLEKMGLGYDAACRHKPDIIYVSITGYGRSGPFAQRAGHDINYIGYTGLLAATGTSASGPVLPAGQIADVAAGYMTVIAALSAVWARERTGKGQHVDVSMLDSALPFMTLQFAHHHALGTSPPPGELLLSGGLPNYNVYACADGKYVALGALEPKFWETFCDLVGHAEWKPMVYALGEEGKRLKQELAGLFKTRPRDEWVALAADHDVCLTPVLELEEATTAWLRSMGESGAAPMSLPAFAPSFRSLPLQFSNFPAAQAAPAPKLSEHTEEILREIGLWKKDES